MKLIEKYREFVNSKRYRDVESGFDIDPVNISEHVVETSQESTRRLAESNQIGEPRFTGTCQCERCGKKYRWSDLVNRICPDCRPKGATHCKPSSTATPNQIHEFFKKVKVKGLS